VSKQYTLRLLKGGKSATSLSRGKSSTFCCLILALFLLHC